MSQETVIDKDGAIVYIYREWMNKDAAMAFFNQLKEEIPWEQNTSYYGYATPRLTYHLGDAGVSQEYSGKKHYANDWTGKTGAIIQVKELRDKLSGLTSLPFNSVLLNYYRDGRDSIIAHSDREVSPQNTTVIGLSLGGTRIFHFRRKDIKEPLISIKINNGDLMVMAGTCQDLYTHAVPKCAKASPRISLTYRLLD